MENKIYENIKMTFEIGNGYGCYCELDEAAQVESFSSSISIQSMKERRYLNVDDDDDIADDLHENARRKNKTNKQIWFMIGVYSITAVVIIVEYLVFCVAKR